MLESKSQAVLSLQDKASLYPIDMSFKDRLRQARKAASPKVTQAAIAKALKVTPQAVSGWERGEAMPEPDKLNDLCDLLKIDVSWLLGKKGASQAAHNLEGGEGNISLPDRVTSAVRNPTLQTVPAERLMGKVDLPVYSIAHGGRGALIVSNEPYTYIARPHNLLGIKESYGVLIIGSSMAREYNENDIAYIDPHRHPKKGDPCLFQNRADDGTMTGILKYLERSPDASETVYYVSQSNPPKKFTLKKADWQTCHVAVGKISGQ